MSVEERASPEHTLSAWDFSSLHGFQFVGAKDGPVEGEASDDEQRRTALAIELDARAARFHQAVDSSIVLASDGAIRWLGDPIARLAAGDDLLAPRTILLADPAMSVDAQAIVAARLDLWLAATVQRLLGPLFSLRSMQEGSGPLQDLAARIANALGVLEREPVRGMVRGLDQPSRAVLRKHGVRFGSYYLYVPSTLRPAARALALQLWCLAKGGEDFNAAAQGLIPMASSGRTSAPPDARVSGEAYRVGGFRSCGDRVVRVDIVERLADMIRAGSVLRVVGSDAGPAAFQVTSQMTSLTGCSGESFASILKALGFESLDVPRSGIVWPAAAAPAAAVEAAAAAEPSSAPEVASDGADPAETGLAPTDEAITGLADEAGSATDGGDAASAEDPPAAPPDLRSAAEDSSTAEPGDEAAPDPAEDSGDAPETAADASAAEDVPTTDPGHDDDIPPPADGPADDPPEPANLASEPAAEAATNAVAEPAPPATGDDTVTIWRFVRLPTPGHQRRPRSFRRKSPAPGERPAGERRFQPQPPDSTAPPPEAAPAADRSAEAANPREKRPARFEKPFHGKRRPWEAEKTQRPAQDKREGRSGPEGRPGGDRKAAIDPMSPFAKLMELRSILEAESKKRK
ncbi:hypothetical protein DFR50_15324 [Roseiarcus fermentans]|uniref:Uncharacterized protein n=1 Tax=Roseiarcus fermentans TaxID=1473586 RepID=A0A366EJ10_9HYPH|nr:hypothetical protein [Roseiarcus fermentans]RBP02324.1 hypothetical protein DFR50_15324 [Roseiarcus fermentans]